MLLNAWSWRRKWEERRGESRVDWGSGGQGRVPRGGGLLADLEGRD